MKIKGLLEIFIEIDFDCCILRDLKSPYKKQQKNHLLSNICSFSPALRE